MHASSDRPPPSLQLAICKQREQQLAQELKSHKFLDAPVKAARLQLRNACVLALLYDFQEAQVSAKAGALCYMARIMAPSTRSAYVWLSQSSLRPLLQAKKLEDTLWQKVFYSPISEFRKRLAAPKAGDARGQELRQKAGTHLLRFLTRHAPWQTLMSWLLTCPVSSSCRLYVADVLTDATGSLSAGCLCRQPLQCWIISRGLQPSTRR